MWLLSVALAGPKVIEIKVPEPSKAPPPPPPPTAPAQGAEGETGELMPPPPSLGSPEAAAAGGRPLGGNAARRGPREVAGEAPIALSGRYEVVQVTRAGQTEDFHIKMDREGRALKQDCITDRLIFDFGEGGSSLPGMLTLAEQQLCSKGGLGSYANELGLELPADWVVSEGGLKLMLPPVEATARLVRVRPPADNDDLNTPSHWLGPVTKMEQSKGEFTVLAEYGRRPGQRAPKAGEAAQDRPAVVHLVGKDFVYHLEPEPNAGLFAEPAVSGGLQ